MNAPIDLGKGKGKYTHNPSPRGNELQMHYLKKKITFSPFPFIDTKYCCFHFQIVISVIIFENLCQDNS